MSVFRINYSQVIRQANTIEDLSRELEKEIARLENILSNMKGNWKGPASNTFQKQCIMLIEDMKDTKNSMSDISYFIKNVADRIKREDEREAQIARRL